jgi:magnesium chelatase family protein
VLRDEKPAESSATIRERVARARERQRARFADTGIRTNAEMTSKLLREHCRLDDDTEATLGKIASAGQAMSARGVNRLIKVARTVADLQGRDEITPETLEEASRYRAVDPLADIALALGTDNPKHIPSRLGLARQPQPESTVS